MRKNVTMFNTITSVFLQLITVINGFIIPKIILTYFGSDTNGLISSLNQFLSYITLLEGGITGVVMANLYKPLHDKDYAKISSIVSTANDFYKKISYIYICYTLVLAILYKFVFNINFSFVFVFSLTLILSISLFIQYMFAFTLKALLSADKKLYIVSLTQSLIMILNIILAYISVKIYPNILVLKFITSILYIIQPIIYSKYVKKYYKISKNAPINKELLKSRWDGFAINIASFIHFSTDATILAIFTDLKTVSIYSVYALVSNGLRYFIMAFGNGINPTIAQLYASKKSKELNDKFEIYEYLIFNLVFILFGVASLLICPFILIYTKNISDANYYQPLFGTLLLVSEGLYLIKYHHMYLSYNANKFKEISKPSYIEAAVNIVLSLILVRSYGLIGVVIATSIAMIYRLIFQIKFTESLIGRKQILFYKKMLIFTIDLLISLLICSLIKPSSPMMIDWIVHAFIYLTIFVVVFGLTSIIFYRNHVDSLLKKIRRS